MDTEKIIGMEINHIKYGKGVIKEFLDCYIKVEFSDNIIKKFRYPDVFENYIKTEDEDIMKEVEKDLEKRRLDEDYSANSRFKKMCDNVRKFDKQKQEEQEQKKQMQIEKQRQIQMMREKMQQERQNNN